MAYLPAGIDLKTLMLQQLEAQSMLYSITLRRITRADDGVGGFTKSTETITGPRGVVISDKSMLKFVGRERELYEDELERTDYQAILLQNSFSGAPKIDDELVPQDGPESGLIFKVQSVAQDPVGVIWILACEQWHE